MSSRLECKNLTKDYGNVMALSDVNLTLESGRIVGLLGPNGSGKTTLIKLANGLLQPTSGEILLNGLKPGPETKAFVSYLPDANYLPDWMNVEALVGMFDDFYADFDRKKAEEMLKQLNLREKDRLKTLSKGNKEKVQLILAMSRNAEIYFLDEPIGGVDPAARDYILNTIIRNYSEDALVVMSTHLISDIMILQRFYKNLLKGEGYLMHTLPVPTWMLVASKTISSLIWVLLSIITLIVSVFVLALTSVAGSGNLFALDWCSLPWGDFFKFFQESAGEIILTIVTAVIQIVRIILLVYTAMAIGAAAKRHKVFYSVLTFIVILIIIAIIGTLTNFNLIEMLNGSMAVDNAGIGVHADAGKGMVVAGYVKLLAGQCITDAIYSVIFFFVTTWFLKNKLNLE